MPDSSRPIEILLVEDNLGDARLTREALREGEVDSELHVVRDGIEALAFLRRQGPYQGVTRPDIVLLDLNLPRKDGREVLAEMKADPELMRIPVVVLTTSESENDIMRCYELHANCYLTKPMELDRFIEVLRAFEGFWLATAKLPPW